MHPPQLIKRRFSRLAGLLELADQEFISIRDDLVKYEKELGEEIEKSPESVLIDRSSVTQFLHKDTSVRKTDQLIAEFCGARIKAILKESEVDHLIGMLNYFEIKTIYDLEKISKEKNELISEFAEAWLTNSSPTFLPAGISLFYLCYILIAELQNKDKIMDYLNEMSIGVSEDRLDNVERISTIYSEITAT